MKLYHFIPAPNPSRVYYYLNEKGLDDVEPVVVDFLKGEQNAPAFRALSPNGTLPVLELDDGTVLRESRAIMEYLEELHPEPPLIGTDALMRAQTRAMDRFIELNVYQRIIRYVHAHDSPLGLPRNPALAENEAKRLPAALERLDAEIGDGPFVMGDRVTIADCTLLAGLNFGSFGGYEVDEKFANVRRWHELYTGRLNSLWVLSNGFTLGRPTIHIIYFILQSAKAASNSSAFSSAFSRVRDQTVESKLPVLR